MTEPSNSAPVETIHGRPIAKANHYVAVRGRIVKDSAIRRYEADALRQIVLYRGKRIDVPFELRCSIYFASSNQDLDNALKSLLDILQEADAITNDSLCRRIFAAKYVDRSRPRIDYQLIPLCDCPGLFDAC